MPITAVKLNWQGGVVCGVLSAGLVVMGFDWIPPDFVFAAMSAVLMACGIINVKQGAAGFSNTGVLTVLVLFVVAEGVSQTGALDAAFAAVLGRARTAPVAQARLMLPVMVASAFLNNTPIVALLIPLVRGWARRNGVPARQLLIPLSFATVFGGTVTTIGTSTNLVVAGLQADKFAKSGDAANRAFGMFDLAPYGLPYALFGAAYIVLFSWWLLPRSDAGGGGNDGRADLVSALEVGPSAAAKGRAVGDVVGRGDLAVTGLARGGHVLPPPPDSEALREGDVLYVAGPVTAARALAAEAGLTPVDVEDGSDVEGGGDGAAAGGAAADILQVRVKKGAPIAGTTIRDARFRERFGAAVVAVERARVPVKARFGDLALAAGDVLALAAGPAFDARRDEFAANFDRVTPLAAAAVKTFSTALAVPPGSRLAGRTIEGAGLRGIQGLYLFAIERGGDLLSAVGGDAVLAVGDVLWFAGDLDAVTFLRKLPGLAHVADAQSAKLAARPVHRRLVQACVSSRSPLVGVTARAVRFRDKYGAVVVAVHREGHTLSLPAADVPLRAGDVLVLETGPGFAGGAAARHAFALISEVPHSAPPKRSRMWIALILVTAMIVSQVVTGAVGGLEEKANLWIVSLLTAALMLAARCLSTDDARACLDWQVYICIAFAFGISTAMEKTNVARIIADVFAAGARAIGGRTAALTGMYLVTTLLSEVLTNNAAAALMYPIASTLATELGIPQRSMSVAVMLGGSAGWVLPWSYQCNLMVYSAGNYRTLDFVKVGAPLYPWLTAGVAVIFAFADAGRWWIPFAASVVVFALSLVPPLVGARRAARRAAKSAAKSQDGWYAAIAGADGKGSVGDKGDVGRVDDSALAGKAK